MSFGAGGALGSWLSGYAWTGVGPTATWLAAAAAAAVGLAVAWRWLDEPPRPAPAHLPAAGRADFS